MPTLPSRDEDFLERVRDRFTAEELVEILELDVEDILEAFTPYILYNKEKIEESM